jgi:phage anti-repressor protein
MFANQEYQNKTCSDFGSNLHLNRQHLLDYALSLDMASEICNMSLTQTHVEVCFEYANFFDERMLLLNQSVH